MRHRTTKRQRLIFAAHVWLHHKAHRIFSTRVFIVACIALVLQILVDLGHLHMFGKVGELFTASIIEHIFFNVPLLEE